MLKCLLGNIEQLKNLLKISILFKMSLFFPSVHTSKNLQSFYCNLWHGNPPAIFKMWRSVSRTQTLSVKFILPHPLHTLVFCAMTCRNPVSCWEPMYYGSVLSVLCYLWSIVKSIFVFEMVCAVYFFLLPHVIVCVCLRMCENFFCVLFPSSTLSLSVFYFFNL